MKQRGHKKEWVIAVLAVLLCVPLLENYHAMLKGKDYYGLWPVFLLVLGVLIFRRWKQAPRVDGGAPRWVVYLLLGLALCMLLFSYLYYTPWVTMLASIVMVGAGFAHLSRYRKIEGVLGLWLLTFLFLRPPYQTALRILAWMENLSTKTASLILDYGSVIHSVQGNVLALPNHDFQIDVICSGYISLVSSLATAGVIAVVRKRSFLQSVTLLVFAVISTWILNVLRILIVVSVEIWYGVDLLTGIYFPFYHVFSFLLVLVLLLSTDALAVFVWSGVEGEAAENATVQARKGWLARMWTRMCHFQVSAVLEKFTGAKRKEMSTVTFSILFVVMLVMLAVEALAVYYRPQIANRKFMYGEDHLSKIQKESVMFDRPGWVVVDFKEEKRDFESIWGALSSIWWLKYHGTTVTMSLDYPFDDWHDVKACYRNLGWKIREEKILDKQPTFKWQASQTYMILPNGDYGFILCSHCDHIGNTVQPKPTETGWKMALYRLQPERMTPPFGDSTDKDKRTFYQTQCMVATPAPLDEATKEEIRIMYAQFREQTRRAIARKSAQNKAK